MHRLVLNTLINLIIVIIALTGAWHFVADQYMGLPLWLSCLMSLVAVGAVVCTVYTEFMHDFRNMRIEEERRKYLG